MLLSGPDHYIAPLSN